MPHDANNNLLSVGDKVVVEAEVLEAYSHADYCNIKVKVTNPAKPFDNPNAMREFWFNAAQLKKVDSFEPSGYTLFIPKD